MKRVLFFLAMSVIVSIAAKAQQVQVGADKSFAAPVSDYKTYAWSNQIDKIPGSAIFVGPNGVLVFNNESTRRKIKDAVQFELDAKGYKQVTNNPDMIVLFRVLEQPTKLTTFNGYTMLDNGLDSTRTPDNVEQVQVDAGTLLINLVDAKSGKVAWQGYASGILKPDMANDKSKIRQAVASIFNQFKYTAKK